MSLIHRWQCSEGSGNTVEDSVGSLDLTPVSGDSVQWGSGDVLGDDRSFVTLGNTRFPKYDGLLTNGTGLGANMSNWTIGMVGNYLVRNINGTTLHFDNALFRTWSNQFQFGSGNVLLTETQLEDNNAFGEWAIYVLVGRGGRYIDVYLNDMTTAKTTLDMGNQYAALLGGNYIYMHSYNGAAFVGSMEYADLSIYNHSMSQSDREDYADQFGSVPISQFSFYRSNNNDFGGLFRWDEDDGVSGSTIEIANFDGENVIKHSGDGNTCQMAVQRSIRVGLNDVYIEADFYIPSTFDGNHDIGDNFLFLALWDTEIATGHNILDVRGEHALPSQDITQGTLSYRNLGSGIVFTSLDGSEITKGIWHNYKLHVDYTNGLIQYFYDDTDMTPEGLSGLTLDIKPKIAYWGLHLGVHPENGPDGNYFYSRRHYVGEVARASLRGNRLGGLLSLERLVS